MNKKGIKENAWNKTLKKPVILYLLGTGVKEDYIRKVFEETFEEEYKKAGH